MLKRTIQLITDHINGDQVEQAVRLCVCVFVCLCVRVRTITFKLTDL